MVYRFLVLSDEVDNFAREISIDSEATFLELQDAILDSVNFTKDQITSFFICEDDWEKKIEVTLLEMETSSEYDNYVMASTHLSDLIEDEKQKLIFVFDNMMDRAFFMELRAIETGKNLLAAECTKSLGNPPSQLESFEDFSAQNGATDFAADMYGTDEYDISEIDEEGFSDFDTTEGEGFDERF